MGVEIRPAGVLAQLEEKAGKLDKMKQSFETSSKAIQNFISDETLQGESYDSAKERFAWRLGVLSALNMFIDRSKQLDGVLSGILSGTFGACDRISEDDYHRQIAKIKNTIKYYQDKVNEVYRNATGDLNIAELKKVEYYKGQVKLNEGALRFPETMLRKISTYVSQTDNLYNDAGLNELGSSIDKANAAFSNASFDPQIKSWKKLDTSWARGMLNSMSKVYDDYNIQFSLDHPGSVKFSSDMQYVYYNGQKYTIDGGTADDFWETGDMGSGVYSLWSEVDSVEIDYSDFDLNALIGGSILAIFGGGEDASPNSDSAMKLNWKKIRLFSGGATGLTITSDELDAIQNSNSSGKIKFSFQKRNGEYRVQILGSGGKTQYWKARNSILSNPSVDKSIVTTSIRNSYKIDPNDETGSKRFFKDTTGTEVKGKVEFGVDLDSTRENEGEYTSQYYFDKKGKLKEKNIIFDNDSIKIWDSSEPSKVYDATNKWGTLEFNASDVIKDTVKR